MEVPQEIIGSIVSFLSTKEAFRLISVSKHWRNSIFHTQHVLDVEDLSHPESFSITMDSSNSEYFRINFVTDVRIMNSKKLKPIHLSFLGRMKKTLRTLTIEKHGVDSMVLNDFPELHTLKLSQSSDLHSVDLKNVPKLKVLDLSKTGIISGTKILSFLDENSLIETIRFNGCSNIYHDLQFPVPCDSLLTLDVSRTMIHRGILEQLIKDCPNLTSLEINRCTMLKHIVIRDHMHLERLSMRFCKGLYGVKILGNSSLKQLDISSNAVFGRFLASILRANPSLSAANFSNCYHFNELSEGFEEISLPELVHLNCHCTTLRDEHVKVLMTVCTGLKTLGLKQTDIHNLLDCGSSTLEVLDISGTAISALGVNEILQRCPSLKDLNIRTCQILRDGMVEFGKGPEVLEIMRIGNTVLSQKSVYEIIDKYPNLRELDMSRINILDNDRVLEIKDAYKLEKLDCTGNNRIEKLVVENCPVLVDLNMTECFRMVGWEFKGDVGFASNQLLIMGGRKKEKIITVVQCREEFIEFLERKFPEVKIVGIERSYEKSTSYQQMNFMRCLERNRLKEKEKNENLQKDGL